MGHKTGQQRAVAVQRIEADHVEPERGDEREQRVHLALGGAQVEVVDEREDQRADDHQRKELAAHQFAGRDEAAEERFLHDRGAQQLEQEDRGQHALLVGESGAFLDGGFGDRDQDGAGGRDVIGSGGRVRRARPEFLRLAAQAALAALARPSDEHEESEGGVEQAFGGGEVHEVSARRAPRRGRRARHGRRRKPAIAARHKGGGRGPRIPGRRPWPRRT